MRRRVVVSLYGGLGNQLFQVAAGLMVADSLGASLYASREGMSGRDALWRMLGDELPLASSALEVRAGGVPDDLRGAIRLALRAARTIGWADGRRLRSDVALDPPPRRFPRPRTVALVGYHQHPSWHAATSDRVVEMLRRARTAAVMRHEGVVVHLRRGDYVRLGWTLTTDYYRRAIATLTDGAHGIGAVTIVSDDPLAAGGLARLLEAEGHGCRVAPSAGGLEGLVTDFWFLADADRLVMSNSTFCWWAAAAGQTPGPDRRIAYPAGWIGVGGDLLHRPGWTAIPSRTDRDA